MTHGGPESRWSSAERRWEEVTCAYCGGRGVDPFGLPGPESRCSVCGGKGYNRVTTPYIRCAACGGTGRQLGRRLTCSACKGRGVTTVRGPVAVCPVCEGTGIHPGSPSRLPCTECSGRGIVRKLRSAVATSEATPPTGFVHAPKPRPRSITASEGPQTVAPGDRVTAHISSFRGVKATDVEAIFGLSKNEAEEMLSDLVKMAKIRKEGELYYPA